jgi:hypothetical protein
MKLTHAFHQTRNEIKSPKVTRKDLALLIALAVCMTGLAALYISRERIFYYWDYWAYQSMTQQVAAYWQVSPLLMVVKVLLSLGQEYNYLFTLPLISFSRWLSLDRLGYVLRLTLVYQLPYVLVTGMVASELVKTRRRRMFWLGAWIAALTPMAWAPTLRGYPDVAAGLMVALAIAIYLWDMELSRWWQWASIGLALSLAMLLRRHFVYDIATIFLALVLGKLVTLWVNRRRGMSFSWQEITPVAKAVAYTVIATLLWIALLGTPFLIRLLTKDYSDLYTSYTTSSLNTLLAYLNFYGWQTWLAACLGLALAVALRTLFDQPSAIFLAVFAAVSLLVWAVYIRISATHYTLHMSIYVVCGLASLAWLILSLDHSRKRSLLVVLFGGWLVFNAVQGLTPVGKNFPVQAGFSKNYSPLFRGDYDQVADLVRYLRQRAAGDQTIYVAASSVQLNDDLLKNAERQLFKKPRLSFLSAPQVDSRDYYPLEPLLLADWVIVATPFQYHLHDPAEQKVVESVVSIFEQNWDLAEDFKIQTGLWQLEPAITVRIYQRSRPTTVETAVKTYSQLAEFIGRRPAGQADWITLSPGASPVQKLAEGSYRLEENISPSDAGPAPVDQAYLYVHNASPVRQISGKWVYNGQECPTVNAWVEFYDRQGDLIQTTPLLAAEPGRQAEFSQPVDSPPGSLLVLRTSDAPAVSGACRLVLDWTMLH